MQLPSFLDNLDDVPKGGTAISNSNQNLKLKLKPETIQPNRFKTSSNQMISDFKPLNRETVKTTILRFSFDFRGRSKFRPSHSTFFKFQI